MTFEEIQLILQSIAVSQRETQASLRETQAALQETQASQRETQAIVASNALAIQAMSDQAAIDRLNHEARIESTTRIVESNARAIQAMLDQAATDRLNHEARMEKLENLSEGLINIVVSLDEDRPTILRKLNTIEQKTDSILDRLPPNSN
jgi:hypothetical protein